MEHHFAQEWGMQVQLSVLCLLTLYQKAIVVVALGRFFFWVGWG
jgi:hypothetical protein